MSFFKKIFKEVKRAVPVVAGFALGGPAGAALAYGAQTAKRSQDKANAIANDQNKQQAALLEEQRITAQNNLADLSINNSADIVAGGTASNLLQRTRRPRSNRGSSISTSLGL